MTDILKKIVKDKVQEIEARQANVSLEELKVRAKDTPKPRNFFRAVTTPAKTLHVIAEIKKASPSAGLIREDFDPVKIARIYHEHGASAISCLTDEKYFQGSLEYIEQIKEAVPLPVLRKDFLVDPYQLYEARAAGADAILLIAECIESDSKLIDLMILATELELTILLEVHSVENLLRVRPHLGIPNRSYVLLGVNNRDLTTMRTDLNHSLRVLDMVEDLSTFVSESGIRTHDDILKLTRSGVFRVLVGEHLMRQDDIGLALRELMHGQK